MCPKGVLYGMDCTVRQKFQVENIVLLSLCVCVWGTEGCASLTTCMDGSGGICESCIELNSFELTCPNQSINYLG